MPPKFLVLTVFFHLFHVAQSLPPDKCEKTVYGDEGDNITLPCRVTDIKSSGLVWKHQGRDQQQARRTAILGNGSLSLTDVSRSDSGDYICVNETVNSVFNCIHLIVRSHPPALVNVSVIPSTVLASMHWQVEDDGGYPITYFTAQYRLKHTPLHLLSDPWHPAVSGGAPISHNSDQIDIYQLKPNSSYIFQVWATNKLGRGEVVELEACTLHDEQEIELAKHLLEGVESFDTRVWVAAVAIVMGTLVILASATVYALYSDCNPVKILGGHPTRSMDDHETMELIPNIIVNPAYSTEDLESPDENSNSQLVQHANNNSVLSSHSM